VKCRPSLNPLCLRLFLLICSDVCIIFLPDSESIFSWWHFSLISPKCYETLKGAFISFVLVMKRKEEYTGNRNVLFYLFRYLKSLYRVVCLVTYHVRICCATERCKLICLIWVSAWISPKVCYSIVRNILLLSSVPDAKFFDFDSDVLLQQ
jgi:hypothetical protein